MENIQRLSTWLLRFLSVFMGVYVGITGLDVLDFAFLKPELWQTDSWVHPDAQITTGLRAVYGVVWGLPVLTGLAALWSATAILQSCARGVIFDHAVAAKFRHMGQFIALSGATDLVAESLNKPLITWNNPDGAAPLNFVFQSESAGLMLCGGGFYLVGWIMKEAIALAEENSGFV